MNPIIRLILLSPRLGPELVTNGTFDTDVNGWTAGSSYNGSFAYSAGTVVCTLNGAGNQYCLFNTTVPTVVGRTYQLSFTKIAGTLAASGGTIQIGSTAEGFDLVNTGDGAASGTTVTSFVATTATTYISLTCVGAAGLTQGFDDISVRHRRAG